MRTLALAFALLLAPVPTAQSSCPFSGVALTSFGTGVGVCSRNVLTATLDAGTCELDFSYLPELLWCGNVFLVRNWLVAAPAPLAQPVPLGAPFLPGSAALVPPARILGPFAGSTSSLAVPPDATLIGQSFSFQSVPLFLSTIPFPASVDLGVSTGLTVTLL